MFLTHAVKVLETPGAEGSDPLVHMGCDVPELYQKDRKLHAFDAV